MKPSMAVSVGAEVPVTGQRNLCFRRAAHLKFRVGGFHHYSLRMTISCMELLFCIQDIVSVGQKNRDVYDSPIEFAHLRLPVFFPVLSLDMQTVWQMKML